MWRDEWIWRGWILLRITGLVEKDVTSFRGLLNVRSKSIEIFNCCRINFVNNIIIKDQPESVRFDNWNVVTPSDKNCVIIISFDFFSMFTCLDLIHSEWPPQLNHTFCQDSQHHQMCWTASTPVETRLDEKPWEFKYLDQVYKLW